MVAEVLGIALFPSHAQLSVAYSTERSGNKATMKLSASAQHNYYILCVPPPLPPNSHSHTHMHTQHGTEVLRSVQFSRERDRRAM